MPINRPTLRDLLDTATAEINALIPGADARVRFSVLNVFSRVWAALVDGLYSVLVFLSRQLFVMTATREYLTLRGLSYGITRLPAAAASGCIILTGTSGISIPSGSIFQTVSGIQYQTTSPVTILASGIIDAPCIALTTGLNTNAISGVILNPLIVVSGLSSSIVCPAGISGGADEEADDALRARILYRLRNSPGVGTVSDWNRWAMSMDSTVTRVWVIPAIYGNGTVGIVFAQDSILVVPSAPAIAQMQSYLAQFTPAGSLVYVLAPTLVSVNFTIHEVPTGDPAIQANIIAELTDLLFREGGPGSVIPLSHITESISAAVGETDHVLSVPSSPISFASGTPLFEVGVMGSVTWI
jgi:uncharacterized phage protein gp47/JayE